MVRVDVMLFILYRHKNTEMPSPQSITNSLKMSVHLKLLYLYFIEKCRHCLQSVCCIPKVYLLNCFIILKLYTYIVEKPIIHVNHEKILYFTGNGIKKLLAENSHDKCAFHTIYMHVVSKYLK